MTEIEKLYENCGIDNSGYFTDSIYPEYVECPPFTPAKQLELIKFLFNHNVYYDVDNKGNYWFHISDDCYTYYYNKFEIALANIINEMWHDLTEEEKQEIKRILEDDD